MWKQREVSQRLIGDMRPANVWFVTPDIEYMPSDIEGDVGRGWRKRLAPMRRFAEGGGWLLLPVGEQLIRRDIASLLRGFAPDVNFALSKALRRWPGRWLYSSLLGPRLKRDRLFAVWTRSNHLHN